MVRVHGAVFGDVTDRATRQLGVVSGWRQRDDLVENIILTKPLGLLTSPIPWSSHYPWGRVVMLDDFESTLKWKQTGGTISRANDATFVHGELYSMKMVTGATAGNAAVAELFTTPVKEDSDYVAMEFYWALNAAAATTPRDFYMTWVVEDQWLNVAPMFGIRYQNYQATVAKERLQLWNSAGAWADIAGGSYKIKTTDALFNYWLVVLKRDPVTGYKYHYFQMNDSGFGLSGTAGEAGAFTRPYQDVVLSCTTDAAAATTAYVDDFVLMDEVQLHM